MNDIPNEDEIKQFNHDNRIQVAMITVCVSCDGEDTDMVVPETEDNNPASGTKYCIDCGGNEFREKEEE